MRWLLHPWLTVRTQIALGLVFVVAAGLPPHAICHVCAERGVLAYLHREDSSSADTHYHWYRCLTCGRSFADSTTPELGPV